MTDEQIEKASQEYVRNNHTVNPYNIIATRESFADGIIYALSHQWISVEERLPEDDRLVIVHIDDLAYPSEISNCMGYFKNGRWQFPDDYYYDCHVTHWCEIPQLNPEKE